MTSPCPFNTLAYASGQAHLGAPDASSRTGLTILSRPITTSPYADGISPWPYLWIGGDADLTSLRDDFGHLVSLAIVTQPGFRPPANAVDSTVLKDHFVYDPSLPPPPMSRRTRARLTACEARGTVAVTQAADRAGRMSDLYRRFVERRELVGAYVDFGPAYFETVAGLESAVFFEVRDAEGVAAMACGVVFEDMLQVLHTASTDAGLQWSASYLLMSGIQEYARNRGVRMLTGGIPSGGRAVLARFKARWANAMQPVHLLRIVNDRRRYDELCAATGSSGAPGDGPATAMGERSDFFPAYRAPVLS